MNQDTASATPCHGYAARDAGSPLQPHSFTRRALRPDDVRIEIRYCGVCHGDAAVSGTLNPDLRHSAAIGDAATIKDVVIDGALEHNGMVSFRQVVNQADAEAIRQYLLKRANEDKALEGRATARPAPRGA